MSPYSSEQGRAGRTICAQQGGVPGCAQTLGIVRSNPYWLRTSSISIFRNVSWNLGRLEWDSELGTLTPQQSCWALTGAGNRGAGTVPKPSAARLPCRHKIAENAGWDCELLAIELPDLAESPGARRPRHSDHRDGKALCLRRRKRWLITVWLEVRVLPAPPRTPVRTGVSWSLTNSAHFGPELAGFLYDRLVSETADLWFGGRIDGLLGSELLPNADVSELRRQLPAQLIE